MPTMTGPSLRAALAKVVNTFSPTERLILMLHYTEQLSIEETAAVLDIGVNTVRDAVAEIRSRVADLTGLSGQSTSALSGGIQAA